MFLRRLTESVGSPDRFASAERSGSNPTQIRQGASPTVRLLLLEPRDSAYAARIEDAAAEAGLTVGFIGSLENIPPDAPLVGIGPSAPEPLQLARQLRTSGPQPLLVFFSSSTRTRDALHAELIRDPFVYPRFELIELPGSVRQLASRMGRVVAQVKRQLHNKSSTRQRRTRSRGSPSLKRLAVKGEHYLVHFLAHTPDAILSTDEAGRIEAWNGAAQRMFEFKSEAVLGRSVGFLDQAENQASGLQNPDLLRIGQVLTIPAQPGWLYRVQPGETLDQISVRTGVAGPTILSASGLSAASVGDVILIPDQALAQSK